MALPARSAINYDGLYLTTLTSNQSQKLIIFGNTFFIMPAAIK